MEKVITIDIQKQEDLIEKYDDSIVNHKLIEYILKKLNTQKKKKK